MVILKFGLGSFCQSRFKKRQSGDYVLKKKHKKQTSYQKGEFGF